MTLPQRFPTYRIITNLHSFGDVEKLLERESGIVDDIALVCADGQLAGFTNGPQVVEFLRGKGYLGPALYMGYSELLRQKEYLFVCKAEKGGNELVDAIQKVLGDKK